MIRRIPGCAGSRGALALVAAVAIGSSATAAHAQSSAPAPSTLPTAPIWAWAGAGAAVPGSRPGTERGIGPSAFLAIELPEHHRLAARVELGADAQGLDYGAGSLLGGDLQQMRLIGALRYRPLSLGRVAPYGVLGAGVAWQSERLTLTDRTNPVPDATFRQTTSWQTGVLLAGAGVATTGARLRAFGEVRWTRANVPDRRTTDVGLIAGLGIPLGW